MADSQKVVLKSKKIADKKDGSHGSRLATEHDIGSLAANKESRYKELSSRIDSWVESFLRGYSPRGLRGNKVFKDPVWGMIGLSPLETSLVDSPLVQKLRRIHQTGLVNLTYPSALHTRFDHSVGMVHCATKMVRAINEREVSKGRRPSFSARHLKEIRLAAILHDTGHACLSHLTEPYFADLPLFRHSLEHLESTQSIRPKTHELISSLIVKSAAFKKLYEKCLSKNPDGDFGAPDESANRIGDMIIGLPYDGKSNEAYVSEVINGPFDADKVDYIFRDSYFTGISLSTDVERFMFGLSVATVPQTKKESLVLDANAASAYDQLVFGKLSLYTNVYNHQKVLATNQMITIMLDRMRAKPSATIKDVPFKDPINFLNLTDWDFLTAQASDNVVSELQRKIARRDLLLRLFRISPKTTEEGKLSPKFIEIYEDADKQGKLVADLCRELGMDYESADTIRLGMPMAAKFDEMVDAYCKHFDDEVVQFNEVFPTDWIKTYGSNKWVAYVYGPQKCANRKTYGQIKDFLEAELSMKFNKKSAPKFYEEVGP